jgi:hypothetical protein
MFDRAVCCSMLVAEVPAVRCQDLIHLKELLQNASIRGDETVIQDQHRPLASKGEAMK